MPTFWISVRQQGHNLTESESMDLPQNKQGWQQGDTDPQNHIVR